MRRRDLLKGAALVAAGTGALRAAMVQGQTGGPFALPTAKFNKAKQHELPNWAFTLPLILPPVPLPHAVGKFEEVHGKAVFGEQDSTPLGDAFHGIAREWGDTPQHWVPYGCTAAVGDSQAKAAANWNDKRMHFGTFGHHENENDQVENWAGFKIKCFKVPIRETRVKLREDTAGKARVYGYYGMVPPPMFKFRIGEPVVVRYENHLEAEMSVHLHGGHSPSHSDGFPTFYVLQGKARDYFYPNILPLYQKQDTKEYVPDLGEAQSTMWYHDHAMDATAYNVSKGLAGFVLCFGEEELRLIHNRILPGYGPHSCQDATSSLYDAGPAITEAAIKKLEDPRRPGFFALGKEPYHNPFDIPLVLQDKVIDQETGQISYDLTDHDGYLGDTSFVNGVPWPKHEVRNRKYRFRILDGSNARVYRLRLMKLEDYDRAKRFGINALAGNGEVENGAVPAKATDLAGDHQAKYDAVSQPFMRIGKDSWLWSYPVEMKSLVLAMANRADVVVDFDALTQVLANNLDGTEPSKKRSMLPGETQEFVLVNTMPQFDGRGPKPKLEDGGDPRVLPLPFDVPGRQFTELTRPIGLMKFVVKYGPPRSHPEDPDDDQEATIVPIPLGPTGDCFRIKKLASLSEEDEREKVAQLNCPLPSPAPTPLAANHRPIPDEEIVTVREFIFERGKGAWQINGRFYDPSIANAAPRLDGAEEWVLRNGGGGWWHPIHIHLESHQLISYEKDFLADDIIDGQDPPDTHILGNLQDVRQHMEKIEVLGLHDTQVLGPNTVARIRMRHRTFSGPFAFHCHNLEHEDMRMMYNFEPVPDGQAMPHDPNIAPAARTHGNHVTLGGSTNKADSFTRNVGELPWENHAIPRTPVDLGGESQIPPRPPAP